MNSGLWLLYAIVACILFGVTNFTLKYASVKGVPSLLGSAVLMLGTGLLGLLLVSYMISVGAFDSRFNSQLHNTNPKYFSLMVLAGVSLGLGIYFLKMAVARGPAGPATAIALSNAVLVAALSWLLLGEKLNAPQIAGMTLYILACTLFALGS